MLNKLFSKFRKHQEKPELDIDVIQESVRDIPVIALSYLVSIDERDHPAFEALTDNIKMVEIKPVTNLNESSLTYLANHQSIKLIKKSTGEYPLIKSTLGYFRLVNTKFKIDYAYVSTLTVPNSNETIKLDNLRGIVIIVDNKLAIENDLIYDFTGMPKTKLMWLIDGFCASSGAKLYSIVRGKSGELVFNIIYPDKPFDMMSWQENTAVLLKENHNGRNDVD